MIKPFLPGERSPSTSRSIQARPFVRAAVCTLLGYVHKGYAGDLAEQFFPHDRDLQSLNRLVTRAASSPQSMGDTSLVGTIGVADFINTLGPSSAAATLLQNGVQLQFDGAGSILVQDLATSVNNATFLGEAGPGSTAQLRKHDDRADAAQIGDHFRIHPRSFQPLNSEH